MKWSLIGACAVVLAGATLCLGQATEDREGSKDHALVSRYPGSFISEYSAVEFDEFTLPLGRTDNNGKLAKSQRLEGKITHIVYDVPAGRSILEVYRNYESALKRGGFAVLFSCVGVQSCGDSGPVLFAPAGNEDWNWSAGLRILSAKLGRAEGDVYLYLLSDSGVISREVPRLTSTSLRPSRWKEGWSL